MGPMAQIARLRSRLKRGRAPQDSGLAWPPGHFYSPIPDLEEIARSRGRIFGGDALDLPGIELNDGGQLALFEELCRHYDPDFFGETPGGPRRYHFDNDHFRHGEALILTALLRHLRPRRVVEVGLGYSSCVILDTRDALGPPGFKCTFVDPYPDLICSRLRAGRDDDVAIMAERVQEVPLAIFEALEAGDCLVIDSTHVSKTGSDVNHYLFEVLPRLRSGVWIHIHDIHFPFEYPERWVFEGRAWNEAYALRAFLQFNAAFEIAFFNAYFALVHAARFSAGMPLAMKSPGSSLWLRRR